MASPGRVLRLSLLAWGLGDLALGRTRRGLAWLVAEALGLVLVAVTTLLLADTTWYLVPFLAGMAFIALWAVQAITAYRRASGLPAPPAHGPMEPPSRHPATGRRAAAAAWLTLPLLAWGTGFWLVAAQSATPGAVLDRFVTAWPTLHAEALDARLAADPEAVRSEARRALTRLESLCAAGRLSADCADADSALLRDLRVRLASADEPEATAVAEVVRYVRRDSRFLGIFSGTELVPVPVEEVLALELGAVEAPFGSRRWVILNAEAPE
ncbi:MAG TPA: hypothetical protein VFH63_05970 [candidate division Zixibacteria bacterium]|nr:hypothetical protein [candidate division Zixibacteria bacterium]